MVSSGQLTKQLDLLTTYMYMEIINVTNTHTDTYKHVQHAFTCTLTCTQ